MKIFLDKYVYYWHIIYNLAGLKEKEIPKNDEELTVKFMFTLIMDVEAWTKRIIALV